MTVIAFVDSTVPSLY